MKQPTIGVIGGSGLYDMEGLTDVCEVGLDTPFGAPSDVFVTGVLDGVKMVFLPRHGRGHRLLPSEVPYRANIHAMKQLGVDRIISVSAVGSMREQIVPGHIVIPDQFFDRTQGKRKGSFLATALSGMCSFPILYARIFPGYWRLQLAQSAPLFTKAEPTCALKVQIFLRVLNRKSIAVGGSISSV